jgi:hypothetical protein
MFILTPAFFRLTDEEVSFLQSQEELYGEFIAAAPYRDAYEPEGMWRSLVSRAQAGDVAAYEEAKKYGSEANYIAMVKLGETARNARFQRDNAKNFLGVRPMIARLKKTVETEMASYSAAVAGYRARLGLTNDASDAVTSKLKFILNECNRIEDYEPHGFERPLSDHLAGLISVEENDDNL